MSDPRFARIKSDPRFRRPRKFNSKVVVDDRFKAIFTNRKGKAKDSTARSNVDKYGRTLSHTHEQDNLRRFYRLENEGEETATKSAPDLARGEVLMESSDESEDVQDDESDLDDIIQLGHDHSKPIAVLSEDAEIDLDESSFADLDAQAAEYSKALSEPNADQPQVTRTRRLAIVNLDWDHVKATHLYKIVSSLVSPTAPALAVNADNSNRKSRHMGSSAPVVRGSVLSVRIYPSQFGKERMAREEKEGPPPEIFKKRQEEDEVHEKNIYDVGDQNEFDDVALRTYQLERLRYYYAVVTCDTVETASHIYSELDGTELERSANVLDLSYVPDDMTFDDKFRDEATGDQSTTIYKPLDFVTTALRHSKVGFTWDDDDPERNQVTRRALTHDEIEKGDFRAYVASSASSDSEEEQSPRPKDEKRGKQANRLRALLLGGGDEGMPEGWGGRSERRDVDMEITFTPGLSEARSDQDETTLEKYQRKRKEKRKKRKEARNEDGAGQDREEIGLKDDFFDAGADEEADDTAEPSRKQDASSGTKSRAIATPSELALLLSSDNLNAEPKHFNMRTILKAEKSSKIKGKKKKKVADGNELQEDFSINADDERFKAVHEDHSFAIDPSNPHFMKTKGMVTLMRARHKRQGDMDATRPAARTIEAQQSLQSLVESVKRKSAVVQQPGMEVPVKYAFAETQLGAFNHHLEQAETKVDRLGLLA